MVNINKILKIFDKKNLIFFFTNVFFLIIILFISNKLHLSFFNEKNVIFDHEYTIFHNFDSNNINSNFAKIALDHKIKRSIFSTNCRNQLSKNNIYQDHIICDPYSLFFGPISSFEIFELRLIKNLFKELSMSLKSMDEINIHFNDDFKIILYTYDKEFDLNLLNMPILNSFEKIQNYEKVFDIHFDYLNNFFDATNLMNDYDQLLSIFNEFSDMPDDNKFQIVNEVLTIQKRSFPRDISSTKLKQKLQAFNINRFTFLFFIAFMYIFLVIILKITKIR